MVLFTANRTHCVGTFVASHLYPRSSFRGGQLRPRGAPSIVFFFLFCVRGSITTTQTGHLLPCGGPEVRNSRTAYEITLPGGHFGSRCIVGRIPYRTSRCSSLHNIDSNLFSARCRGRDDIHYHSSLQTDSAGMSGLSTASPAEAKQDPQRRPVFSCPPLRRNLLHSLGFTTSLLHILFAFSFHQC